ncbi:glycerol-3-phosphate ABC transporter ATP-binding protein [Dictyobacter alpinus]|uniref:Glycerol-3-phosphate ABC transporter ATP-binding protein n=1 Tax=Dictyobacter alpinus TaxID=2014873 RepID=A0A402BEG5_9CHLR|nr:ABC transporter ATP-binding protein [Dictyobacter alpinus]GCE29690.1 glycerol-3-phosphate ABC transporter ATP-binding protein [Dictyobacter alpinus]
MSAIAAQHLVKRFKEKVAVDDISFEVPEGHMLVLVGPSGCGKTTTLRMLAGLEPVSSGAIRFGERDMTEIRPRDRNLAMVFQDYAIFPHMTVYENIAYGLRSRHAPGALIKQRVPDAARLFHIDPFLKRKPRQLSGGERQRVALARALVRDATLYLYDEPLANLDAQLRLEAREDILLLHRQKGMPSIYVTHDQSEAMALGDTIAVMRDGQIQQMGSGQDLYERPINEFVAFFIGTPSINLFDVDLVADGEDIWARNAGMDLLLPAELREKVASYVGKQVRLGIRPEDYHVPKKAPFPVGEENTVQGYVNVIEPTSVGSTVYCTSLEEEAKDFTVTFKLRLPASYIGKEIPLAINTRKLHLFDKETGASLIHSVKVPIALSEKAG